MKEIELIHLTPEQFDKKVREVTNLILDEVRGELKDLKGNLFLLKTWLTEAEAARYLDISRRAVAEKRRTGDIRAKQRGQKFYYKQEWLDEYLETE